MIYLYVKTHNLTGLKYGVDYPQQVPEIIEKAKAKRLVVFLERYGIENPLQIQHVKERRAQTFREISHQQGDRNSQYGSMWITDGVSNRKIRKVDIVPEGWYKGRVT
jgi:hypothetical protein